MVEAKYNWENFGSINDTSREIIKDEAENKHQRKYTSRVPEA